VENMLQLLSVVTKRQRGREVTVLLAILNLAEQSPPKTMSPI